MHPNIKEQIEPNFSIHSKFKLLKGRFLKQKHKLNCLVRMAIKRVDTEESTFLKRY